MPKSFDSSLEWDRQHKKLLTSKRTLIETSDVQEKALSYNDLWLRDLEHLLIDGTIHNAFLQHPVCYAAINAIGKGLVRLPYELWSGKDKKVENHKIYDLLAQPNPLLSGQDLWYLSALFMYLFGEAFWVLVSSLGMQAEVKGSLPAHILIPEPKHFKEKIENNTLVGWDYMGKMTLPLEKVIHFKFTDPTKQYRGVSPLKPLKPAIESDYLALKYYRKFFERSAQPLGIIELDKEVANLDPEDVKAFKQKWNADHRGVEHSHAISILMAGMKYVGLAPSMVDTDFWNGRVHSRDEILSTIGVPKTVAGYTESINYATAREQQLLFYQNTVFPLADILDNTLQAKFVDRFAPGLFGEFNKDVVETIQEKLSGKIEQVEKLWKMGVPLADLNDLYDLGIPDRPEHDTGYVPMGVLPTTGGFETPPKEPAKQIIDVDKYDKVIEILQEPQRLIEYKDARSARLRQQYVLLQRRSETLVTKKIRSYLYNQRKKVLELISGAGKGITKDQVDSVALITLLTQIWEEENFRLTTSIVPIFEEISTEAGKQALTTIGLDEGLFSLQDITMRDVLARRVNLIQGVNQTTWTLIRDEIGKSAKLGETTSQLADRIRNMYNFTNARATVIARTETGSLISTTSYNMYQTNGVPKKSWLVAGDEATRESHMRCASQGAIPIDQAFVNGLQHPGDPNGSAAEVCNCRCCCSPLND